MEYLNEFHRQSTERKLKKIEEWRKVPTSYETVMKHQRARERNSKEFDEQHYPLTNEQDEPTDQF